MSCKNKGDPSHERFRLPIIQKKDSVCLFWVVCFLFGPIAITRCGLFGLFFFIFLTTCYLPAYMHPPLLFLSPQTIPILYMHACMYGRSSLFSLSIYSDNTYVYIFMLCFIHLCMFKVFLLYIYWSPSYSQKMTHSSPTVSTDHALVRPL